MDNELNNEMELEAGEMMQEAVELSDEELEGVTGGKISFKKRKAKTGFVQHQVTAGDTLIRIANRYGVKDWRLIRKWNPHINPKTYMIVNGEWLYIKT